MSLQYLRSYQDGHPLETVHTNTHRNFIVLPHWETRVPAQWPDILLSHITVTLSWHWANQSSPYLINAEFHARKWQVPFLHGFTGFWLFEVKLWIGSVYTIAIRAHTLLTSWVSFDPRLLLQWLNYNMTEYKSNISHREVNESKLISPSMPKHPYQTGCPNE